MVAQWSKFLPHLHHQSTSSVDCTSTPNDATVIHSLESKKACCLLVYASYQKAYKIFLGQLGKVRKVQYIVHHSCKISMRTTAME